MSALPDPDSHSTPADGVAGAVPSLLPFAPLRALAALVRHLPGVVVDLRCGEYRRTVSTALAGPADLDPETFRELVAAAAEEGSLEPLRSGVALPASGPIDVDLMVGRSGVELSAAGVALVPTWRGPSLVVATDLWWPHEVAMLLDADEARAVTRLIGPAHRLDEVRAAVEGLDIDPLLDEMLSITLAVVRPAARTLGEPSALDLEVAHAVAGQLARRLGSLLVTR